MQTLIAHQKDTALAGPLRIYWLAYLLSGQRGLSLDVTAESLESPDDSGPFFSTWMLAWSRRVFIAKVLAEIRGELRESAQRTILRRPDKGSLPSRDWTIAHDTTKVQLQSALLAIDLFPRCVLLLSIFEGVQPEDISTLLDVELDLVWKAQSIGMRDLTINLAGMQGWTSMGDKLYVRTSEASHA
jgi:DNA-directed RNA polymerase specialized sigma24 family protein